MQHPLYRMNSGAHLGRVGSPFSALTMGMPAEFPGCLLCTPSPCTGYQGRCRAPGWLSRILRASAQPLPGNPTWQACMESTHDFSDSIYWSISQTSIYALLTSLTCTSAPTQQMRDRRAGPSVRGCCLAYLLGQQKYMANLSLHGHLQRGAPSYTTVVATDCACYHNPLAERPLCVKTRGPVVLRPLKPTAHMLPYFTHSPDVVTRAAHNGASKATP